MEKELEAEYKKLKKKIEKAFEGMWGARCENYDLDDFPDLKNKPDERCATCSAYDKLDAFIEDLKTSL